MKDKSAPEPERGGNQAEATRTRWRNKFFEDYSKASRKWDDFHRTQNLETLREAASILEDAHERLQANEDYWEKLRNLPNELETENQKAEAEEALEDFDFFLAREAEVLVRVAQLHPKEDVVRFLDVVNDAVRDRDRAYRMARFSPDKEAIKTLRDQSKDLQQTLRTVNDEISAVLDSNEPHRLDDPRRYRWVHAVRKSLLFLSGSGLAAFNMFLLDPSNPAAPSVIAGAQTMIQQIPEAPRETIKKEVRAASETVIHFLKGFRND